MVTFLLGVTKSRDCVLKSWKSDLFETLWEKKTRALHAGANVQLLIA